VYHLISGHPGLPEPSSWSILKQSWRAMTIEHLLVSNHFYRKHKRQILFYPDSAIRFSHTHFYWPCQFHGDTTLNKDIIQDLTPNWIISFLEVYKELMHCFVVFPFFLKYLTNANYIIRSWPIASKSTLIIHNNFFFIWS